MGMSPYGDMGKKSVRMGVNRRHPKTKSHRPVKKPKSLAGRVMSKLAKVFKKRKA